METAFVHIGFPLGILGICFKKDKFSHKSNQNRASIKDRSQKDKQIFLFFLICYGFILEDMK